MRNIFLFIRRYFNFLVFVILQVICISLIVQYSKYHHAMFGNSANKITGKVNSQYNNIEYYFRLKKTNDSLVKANERLYNMLAQNYEIPDSMATRQVIDSIRVDSILQFRKYTYMESKVVANSVTAQNNYVVLHSPSVAKMRPGMGVVDPGNAVIGVITEVSGNYAVVMSLLHKDSKISGKLFKTGETGTVTWDGKNPSLVTLSGISKGVKVAKGDSVITSGFSAIYPRGLLLGRIDEIYQEAGTSNFRIVLRTGANFHSLEYAYAIDNSQQQEINKLLENAKNKNK
ncbi:MAG: rod shape-determining protein MreC [Chitinophagaceae bacterium]|nr:MAG: rod shape-determining protein MreC [Chitinophagaceae bacterium]